MRALMLRFKREREFIAALERAQRDAEAPTLSLELDVATRFRLEHSHNRGIVFKVCFVDGTAPFI